MILVVGRGWGSVLMRNKRIGCEAITVRWICSCKHVVDKAE